MLDILFKNITIVDGTKAPAYIGNVGVKDGKIVMDGVTDNAEHTVDGTGLHISPGFIDAHSHGDGIYGTDFWRMCKISQGITTEITGQCGSSMFPVRADHADELKRMLSLICRNYPSEYGTFTSFKNYLNYVNNLNLAANAKQLIGHGSLRVAVMGYQNRKCNRQELEAMKAAIREAMENGALGMSSGLIYSPSCFADTDELVELCKVVSEYGGVYETHMRNESFDVVNGVKEALKIGKEAKIPVFISHHKIQGRPYWGDSIKTLQLIDEAIEKGQEVTIDEYPYLASMTNMNAIIPPKYFSNNLIGLTEMLKDADTRVKIKDDIENPMSVFENQYINCGGWDNIQIASMPKTPKYDGMMLSDVATEYGKDGFETLFDLLVKNECSGTCIYYSMCDEDLCRIFKNPNTVVGTDGLYSFKGEKSHPRAWGTFPHAICHFVKEKKIVSLEEMIHKITLLPAERTRIEGKGAIKDGWDADLVVFDYDKLIDKASYNNPDELSEGIEFVLVNGEIVYNNKQMTGEYPGKLLLHRGRR